jgi:hypothetical protein
MALVLGEYGRPWLVQTCLGGSCQAISPSGPERYLIECTNKYWVTISPGNIIEGARTLAEIWLLPETNFDRQTAFVDGLLSQLLKTERVVNDVQILSYYDRVLQAIQKAEEVGRMQDFLSPNLIEVLLTVLPRKEANYSRMDQLNVAMDDLPIAFYSFTRRRLRELRSNTTSMRTVSETSQPQDETALRKSWEGPCVMGSLCGESRTPESCNIFDKLSLKGRLAVI